MPTHHGLDQALWPAIAAAALFILPSTAGGQNRLLPDTPTFSYPLASTQVEGLVGRVVETSVSDNALGPGTEADVGIGKIFPLLALQDGKNPLHVAFEGQVTGRFSMHDDKSSLLSSEWWVGFNLTKQWAKWDATLQLYHESSHLGDELAETFSLTRLDWTRAVVAAWVGRRLGPFRLAGSVSRVLRGKPDLPPLAAAAGLDWFGPHFGLAGTPIQVVAGVFGDAAAQTEWRLSVMGRVGLVLGGAGGRRSLSISFIAYDGVSLQSQFYDQSSSYLGGELRLDL
ncbi:MAG: DUF1207 domain-containing protein [Gemmatimonadales bacterium]